MMPLNDWSPREKPQSPERPHDGAKRAFGKFIHADTGGGFACCLFFIHGILERLTCSSLMVLNLHCNADLPFANRAFYSCPTGHAPFVIPSYSRPFALLYGERVHLPPPVSTVTVTTPASFARDLSKMTILPAFALFAALTINLRPFAEGS